MNPIHSRGHCAGLVAQAVKRQSESLKEQILRLEEQLDVGKAAYED